MLVCMADGGGATDRANDVEKLGVSEARHARGFGVESAWERGYLDLVLASLENVPRSQPRGGVGSKCGTYLQHNSERPHNFSLGRLEDGDRLDGVV
jgi:hypothetical protein